ncbi:hypothetical protein HDC90_005018 [Pedobacter sp. AK013]|uniref:hypothetical protein n=1 Tax=Pedobacter sp. AK013 TaxID=2723071 RepID=UPI001607FDE5|nr:hypothetical protein [Pedobacter sp. AK013]MBB6240344.1 hypothetical protein [Pedobacter sp. AK013]
MNFKFLIISFLLSGSGLAYAQNTFPTSGPAGIGTLSPDAPLQIFVGSDSKPAGVVSAAQSTLKFSRAGTPGYSYNESAEFRITHGGPYYWGSRLDLFMNGASNQTNVPDQHAMTWQYNGNVGIGTIDPSATLDVQGTAKFGGHNANLDISGNPAAYQNLIGTGKMLIGWNRSAGQGETDFIANEGAGSQGGFAFYSYNNASQEKQLLRVLGNGNVGIGTPNPQDKLTVAGNIGAREIKVSTNAGADFVFEPAYKLTGLAELEKFVKANKHLPEIPTAKQMVENGVNLGELNIKLLQKVEELTLHLIEKDKQLKNEKEVNRKQQEQIDCVIKELANVRKITNR